MKSIVPSLRKAILTLWIAVSAAFFLARLTGDPARMVAGEFATPESIAQVRTALGLDEPLWRQYVEYLWLLVRGDLGQSLQYDTANLELILERFPSSAKLAVAALILAGLVGVPLGMFAAAHNGRLLDRLISSVAILGQSMPQFWIGLILIWVFATGLGWFPAGQAREPASIVLPAVTLATLLLAQIARLARSSLAAVLEEDYILSATARGIPRRSVLWRHALRNAALPIVTIIGLQVGALLSGAVTVEAVFAWPGLGSLTTQAVSATDFQLVQALVVVGALVFVVVNLCVDLLYRVLDPRLRVGQT